MGDILDYESFSTVIKGLENNFCYPVQVLNTPTNISFGSDNPNAATAATDEHDNTRIQFDDKDDDAIDVDEYKDDKNVANQNRNEYEQNDSSLDDEIDSSQTQDQINRDNYRCLSINKWRYKATITFVKYVETHCSSFMKVLGYQFVGDDEKTLRNVEINLVKPNVKHDIAR